MNATVTKRTFALLTGVALLAPVLATPARAADNKRYKTGAAILGAVSGYFVLQGKTVPGVIAGAGAYYAYKKSRDAERKRYGSNYDPYYSGRESRNRDNRNRDNGYDPVYDDARDDYGYYGNGDDSYRRDDAYDVGGYDAYPDDAGYDSLKSDARPVLK